MAVVSAEARVTTTALFWALWVVIVGVAEAATTGGGGDDHDLAAPAALYFLLLQDGNGGANAVGRAENVGLENVLHFLHAGFVDGLK